MAQPETHIPDFSLPASTGQTLSRESFEGKVPLAIVFLAGLDQDRALVRSMNEALRDFGGRQAQLLAVVRDTVTNVRAFAEDAGIVMPILADAAGSMARDYGAATDGDSANRMAVVADAEGRVVRRLAPLPDEDAVETLLATVGDLGTGPKVEPAQD